MPSKRHVSNGKIRKPATLVQYDSPDDTPWEGQPAAPDTRLRSDGEQPKSLVAADNPDDLE